MPAVIPTLSNCYVPLTTVVVTEDRKKKEGRPSGDMKSVRSNTSLRYLCLNRSVLSRADGSSLVELGHTKVVCRVTYGPSATTCLRTSGGGGGGGGDSRRPNDFLQCEIRYSNGFGIRPQTDMQTLPTSLIDDTPLHSHNHHHAQELEYSARLRDALLPSLLVQSNSQHSILDVSVSILQADGSIFSACVTAATLALADAGVPLYDLVSSCSVAIQSEQVLLDPSEDEIQNAQGVVTLSMLSNFKEVTFWDQTGRISSHLSSQALELCKDGCMAMHKFMKHCLVTPISTTDTTNQPKHILE